ncbi:MAG: hypothetical protein EXS13_15260, partial [Planctomycetes bacterium]|nr:hypothetical protein [Planctomycetota bacterium]
MFHHLISSALLLLAEEGGSPAAGESIELGGVALDKREQVDGEWRAGTCRITTPLPVGYPAPTVPGAIELKSYPAVRKAEATAALGPEIGRNLAFWKLFKHIQNREIAMTAPVEMRLDTAKDDSTTLDGWKMAFLYRETTMGNLGEDGEVAVVDDEPITVISIGVKGDYSTDRALSEAEAL